MLKAAVLPPTLILFTREPLAGLTKTRLIPRIGAANAAALAHAFTLDALVRASVIGLPIVVAASGPEGSRSHYFRGLARRFSTSLIDQGVGTLGARMRRSLEPYSANGALLIGTDTPSMPPRFIERGIILLRQAPVVLGPSLDGGYYLVATRGEPPDIFRGIRWGGSRVLTETITRLRCSETRFALTPTWYDIDRWDDLLLLAAHLRILRRAGTDPCPTTAKLLRQLGLL